ncbi:MAG: hypothetical protein WCD57_18280 [Acidobacteriaceae bacterium]
MVAKDSVWANNEYRAANCSKQMLRCRAKPGPVNRTVTIRAKQKKVWGALQNNSFDGVRDIANPPDIIAPYPLCPELLFYLLKPKLKITLRHFHCERPRLESTSIFGWALHTDEVNERSKPFGQHHRITQRGVRRSGEIVGYE